MTDPLWLVIGVILAAGIFGGLVNYWMSKPDDVPPPSGTRSIGVGVAASFLVPLFLKTISSNLLKEIADGDRWGLLVLLGFCLVAAISSTAFIRTLSDRVLAEARQAKQLSRATAIEMKTLKEEVQPIVARERAANLKPQQVGEKENGLNREEGT